MAGKKDDWIADRCISCGCTESDELDQCVACGNGMDIDPDYPTGDEPEIRDAIDWIIYGKPNQITDQLSLSLQGESSFGVS